MVAIMLPMKLVITHVSTIGSPSGSGPNPNTYFVNSNMLKPIAIKDRTIAEFRSLKILNGIAMLLTYPRTSASINAVKEPPLGNNAVLLLSRTKPSASESSCTYYDSLFSSSSRSLLV